MPGGFPLGGLLGGGPPAEGGGGGGWGGGGGAAAPPTATSTATSTPTAGRGFDGVGGRGLRRVLQYCGHAVRPAWDLFRGGGCESGSHVSRPIDRLWCVRPQHALRLRGGRVHLADDWAEPDPPVARGGGLGRVLREVLDEFDHAESAGVRDAPRLQVHL